MPSGRQTYMMQRHRQNVREAQPRIDSRPPTLNLPTISRFHRCKEDYATLASKTNVHKNLINQVTRMLRKGGMVDSFPKRKQFENCRIRDRLAAIRRIQEDNRQLAKRLMTVKAETKTRRSKHSIPTRPQRPSEFEVPCALLDKYSNLKLPVDEFELRRTLRPCIFFDMAIKNEHPLGRIVIELFTEASPLVVLEFVRMCTERKHELVKIVRLFPSLWIEGELRVDTESELDSSHEYDMRALDHNSGPGILSYGLSSIRTGFLNFTISFRPLCVVNGRRIAFGRVISNMEVLSCIETAGTKKGRPLKEIVVTNCGLLSRRQHATQIQRPLNSVRRSNAELKRLYKKPLTELEFTNREIGKAPGRRRSYN